MGWLSLGLRSTAVSQRVTCNAHEMSQLRHSSDTTQSMLAPSNRSRGESMKTLSFGLATVIATMLFETFGSVGVTAKASVSTHVASMYAVLPDGALVDLSAIATSKDGDRRSVKSL